MRVTFPTIFVFFIAAAAYAHVTIWPRESRTGAGEKYVVRVPTEGSIATTSVELEIPAGVTVVAVGAPAGFTYELKRDGDRISTIAWTMEIKPGEFGVFFPRPQSP